MHELDLRNLPPEVLARLADADVDLRHERLEVLDRGRIMEARSIVSKELRVSEEGGDPTVDGYATVYEFPYEVAGGAPYGWVETIAEGACVKSVRERDDVRLLINHDGMALGRTKSNTLALESDSIGLHFTSTLDASNTDAMNLASAMKRGDMDECSFAFQVLRQEWNADFTERRILEVKLFDVSVVTYPANPAAVAQLRASEPAPEITPAPEAGMSVALARALRDQLASVR